MIVVCPSCDGKPIVQPFEQMSDKPCFLCGGRGKIDKDRVCRECGRPAVETLFDTPVCRSFACQKILKDKQDRQKATGTEITKEELEAAEAGMTHGWGGWAGMV